LLEDQIDEELSDLKVRMEEACKADNATLQNGQPALQKLKLLPEVTAMLSRQNAQDAILDPEINFLQHVRFFLEPLPNGTLPAYTIQRDLFTALTSLPVQKEALISSKIGGLVLFYTRSKQPEVGVKRMAERLVEEWSRPILNKTDDWSKRQIETRYFDAESTKRATVPGSQVSLARRPAASQSARDLERERILAPSAPSRFRPTELPANYTVAPKSTFQPGMSRTADHRPIGAGGIEAFRRMTQKSKKR
jgi:transcription factor SPN1